MSFMPKHVLLTREEAAEYLSVHPQTLHRWVTTGKIPYIQAHPRSKLRFRRSDLDAMLKPKLRDDVA